MSYEEKMKKLEKELAKAKKEAKLRSMKAKVAKLKGPSKWKKYGKQALKAVDKLTTPPKRSGRKRSRRNDYNPYRYW